MKLIIEKLNVYYGRTQILKDVSVNIKKNSITAIIGQSGCGKSTFLKSINRIIEEDNGTINGRIMIDGNDVQDLDRESLSKKIGMVFQNPIVFPTTVEKNISYVLDYHYDYGKEETKEEIKRLLKLSRLYDEVKGNMKLDAEKLSGGQQQRLAIARSLSVQPEVLLLDEPCSALDMKNTMEIEEMIKELKKDYTVVIVTHNLNQAKRIADEVVFMDSGKIIEIAKKDEFFNGPKTELGREYIKYM